jgi:hypothetical protein
MLQCRRLPGLRLHLLQRQAVEQRSILLQRSVPRRPRDVRKRMQRRLECTHHELIRNDVRRRNVVRVRDRGSRPVDGRECCVESGLTCAEGSSYSCTIDAKGRWTGALCCVGDSLQCVSGSSYACTIDAKGAWTGARCCVPRSLSCRPGSSYDCTVKAKGRWTGSLCCL